MFPHMWKYPLCFEGHASIVGLSLVICQNLRRTSTCRRPIKHSRYFLTSTFAHIPLCHSIPYSHDTSSLTTLRLLAHHQSAVGDGVGHRGWGLQGARLWASAVTCLSWEHYRSSASLPLKSSILMTLASSPPKWFYSTLELLCATRFSGRTKDSPPVCWKEFALPLFCEIRDTFQSSCWNWTTGCRLPVTTWAN